MQQNFAVLVASKFYLFHYEHSYPITSMPRTEGPWSQATVHGRRHDVAQLQIECACTDYVLAVGLRDAYSDLVQKFIQQKEAFPVEQVLAPACAQMASRQDNAKLARMAHLLLYMHE